MTDKKQSVPQGVVVVATNPAGKVIANAADFERQTFGGFTLQQGQAVRATQRAKWEAVKAYMSSALADALDSYTMDRVWERMREKGWSLTTIPVGHEEESA